MLGLNYESSDEEDVAVPVIHRVRAPMNQNAAIEGRIATNRPDFRHARVTSKPLQILLKSKVVS